MHSLVVTQPSSVRVIASPEPTEAQIQHQAYLLWQAGGCQPGRELDDWLQAREMLRHRPMLPQAQPRARAPKTAAR